MFVRQQAILRISVGYSFVSLVALFDEIWMKTQKLSFKKCFFKYRLKNVHHLDQASMCYLQRTPSTLCRIFEFLNVYVEGRECVWGGKLFLFVVVIFLLKSETGISWSWKLSTRRRIHHTMLAICIHILVREFINTAVGLIYWCMLPTALRSIYNYAFIHFPCMHALFCPWGARLQRISRFESDYLNQHNCPFIHMYAHKPCFAIQISILKILPRFNRKHLTEIRRVYDMGN